MLLLIAFSYLASSHPPNSNRFYVDRFLMIDEDQASDFLASPPASSLLPLPFRAP